jgi:hypothetical protein
MLRKLSTFRKDRKKSTVSINSVSGDSNGVTKHVQPEKFEAGAERDIVNPVFAEFAQVIHASKRPLPDQTGEGSYIGKEEPTGLLADLKNLGFKDLKTLKDVIGSKASGELVDDKTYLMERVIQVSTFPSHLRTPHEPVEFHLQSFFFDSFRPKHAS